MGMLFYDKMNRPAKECAVALGCFDGVHAGHIRVLNCALRGRRNGLSPVVFTFSDDPKKVSQLMDYNTKVALFEKMGFEGICAPAFERVKNMEPEQFVKEILCEMLHAKRVCCGYNYHFGRYGSGDASCLSALCSRYGIETITSSPVAVNGDVVSSTRIRQAISEGNMEYAQKMLTRPYYIDFLVVKGRQLGRRIGAPTINQRYPQGMLLPRFGVYASVLEWQDKWYAGVTNIGIKPTVGAEEPLAETWIKNFSANLYGCRPNVYLLSFLRPECKFETIMALKEQIHNDGEKAQAIAEKYLTEHKAHAII